SFNRAFQNEMGQYILADKRTENYRALWNRAGGYQCNGNGDFWKEKYDYVLQTGEDLHFEIEVSNEANGGKKRWRDVFLSPVYFNDGEIREVSGISHDITEKKSTELNLVDSEEKFRSIIESFQDIYFRVKPSGILTMVSPSVESLTGYSSAHLVGKPITDYYLYSPKTKKLFRQLIVSKSVRDFEASMISKDNKKIIFICNIQFIYDKNGKPVEIEGVARDVTQLKQANLELQQSKELALNSLKAKQNFLANMSHEIRTPMNGIMGMIDLIANTELDQEQQRYVQTIRKSSETLLNILNDILDLSKIEAGKMTLYQTPVRLTEIREKLMSLFSHQAMERSIKFDFQIHPDLQQPWLLLDETRVLQVLTNLVSNALKFTKAEGRISVNVRLEKVVEDLMEVRVDVRDTGIGISAENLQKIFGSFNQADISTSKSYGGVGLGLAISRQLCKMMGGDIGVNSKEGEGSLFWFSFKTREAENSGNGCSSTNKQKVLPLQNYFSEHAPRVLLCDDNSVNRMVAGEILKKSGCRVDLADSGYQAIKELEENIYDVVFMDIQMPEMDGVETVGLLREKEEGELPPLVAMTAYAMKEDRERFLSAGFDDYLSKPIKAQDLLRMVKKHVGGAEVQQAEDEQTSGENCIIDMAVVRQLSKHVDVNALYDIYKEYEIESEELLINCKKSIRLSDYPKILSNLHTLKGNSGTLGIQKVHEWAKHIENKLKADRITELEDDFLRLEEAFGNFKDNFSEILKS
ncbi:MAG: ATP-binding protein, partial [Cytophagales bacterium]|nr:ATP-binding protein [Cytophagales bacterium]